MGKTHKIYYKEEDSEEFTDDYIRSLKQKSIDKRKERRYARALKTMDIDELLENDPDLNC